MLTNTREVIAALGGIKAVAELTGRNYDAACNWNRFARFPANTFNAMQRALAQRGLSAPAALWGQSEPVDDTLPIDARQGRRRVSANGAQTQENDR